MIKKSIALAIFASLCSSSPYAETKGDVESIQEKEKVNVSDLKIEDTVVGTGEEAKKGDTIKVHYTGTLLSNGKKFDSSLDRGRPFEFTLGAGEVIEGWDKGFAGMKVGGKRKLTIPSHMGYGEWGAGDAIPPHADLVFEVELLGVHKG